MQDYQIVWRGIVHDSTGYSQVSRNSVLYLDKLGVDVKVEVFSHGTPHSHALLDDELVKLNELIEKPISTKKPTIQVIHLQPNAYIMQPEDKNKFTKRIGFTVWETNKIPDEWIPLCNEMDAIIVPSQFNKRVFQESGVTVPIYVARHGIDTDKFKPGEDELNFSEELPTTRFLTVCSWQHRKGIDLLLDAYYREFTAKDDVALIIKTSGFPSTADAVYLLRKYRDNLGLRYEPPRVYISSDDLNSEDMSKLYNTATCFVLPSRGEGVGLPYLEAMASGLPCIAPKWGGQMDFINKSNAFLVNGEMVNIDEKSANFPWFKNHMKWFEADRRHLANLMREVHRSPKEAVRKGKKAYENIVPEWQWDNTIKDLVAIFDYVIK